MSSVGWTGNFSSWTPNDVAELHNIKVPNQKCDECRKRRAKHWFGFTSVILCGDPECLRKQQEKWNEAMHQQEADDKWNRDNGYV